MADTVIGLREVFENHLRLRSGHEPPHASIDEVVERCFHVAAVEKQVACISHGKDLVVTCRDTLIVKYSSDTLPGGVLLRPLLARLAYLVNAIQFPADFDESSIEEDTVERYAANIETHYPEGQDPLPRDVDIAQKRSLARTIIKHEMRNEVFARLGIVEANPYGFEAEVEYPLSDGSVCRFRVHTSNTNGRPYSFEIQSLHCPEVGGVT